MVKMEVEFIARVRAEKVKGRVRKYYIVIPRDVLDVLKVEEEDKVIVNLERV